MEASHQPRHRAGHHTVGNSQTGLSVKSSPVCDRSNPPAPMPGGEQLQMRANVGIDRGRLSRLVIDWSAAASM